MVDVRTSAPVVGVPRNIGKYRIIGQLGRGGMADLYLAVTEGIGGFSKLHVLKLIRTDSFSNADAVQMFVTEARVTALLNHPNLVQTHEVGEDPGLVFMVMEYLDGQSLDLILARNQSTNGFGIGLRLRTIAEVLNGLHHAHELCDLEGRPLGLVHRDVSPHNIFVTYDGGIKLLDFGVAKTTSANSPTRAGTIKGKIAYMAPEQVSSPGQVTRAADIFQVGLILWEGVLGEGVWQGLSEYEVLLKLSNSSGLPLQIPSDADPELVRICRRATAWKPEERYPTAEEFNREIEMYMASRNLSVSAKQVGAYVAAAFAQRRAEVREAVARRLKSIQSDPLQSGDDFEEVTTAPLIPEIVDGRPRTRSGRSSSSGVAPFAGASPPETSGGGQVIKRKRIFPILGLIAGVIASALAGSWVASMTGKSATAKTSAPITAPVVTRVPTDERVQVYLEAVPATAKLFLDGRALPSNPFSGRMSKDGVFHAMRAEAQGYESASLAIQLDSDKREVISLSPIPHPAPTAGTTHTVPSRRTQGGPSQKAARRISGSPEAPSLPRGADTPRSIKLDQSDPWK